MEINQLIQLVSSSQGQDFLSANQNTDIHSLFFKFSKDPTKKALISQLALRKKLIKKIPQWLSNPAIVLPMGISPEQASSEVTAQLKASFIKGKSIADITGGMGIDSYYLSQNFVSSYYVEQNSELHHLAKHNFSALGQNNISCFNQEGIDFISNTDTEYVYIDPARRGSHNEKLISLSECQPDVTKHLDVLLDHNRVAVIKSSPMLDIKLAVTELKYVYEIWIISHKNECKELVFLLKKETELTLRYRTFNIKTDSTIEEFSFEDNPPPHESNVNEEIESYLYEPNASIQKSGGVDALGRAFGIKKLHPNTHLHTSSALLKKYPGRTFKVINVLKPYDRSLKKQRFNVISRNYPDKANIIENRLRLKPSHSDYLIACQISSHKYVFMHAQRIDLM